MIEITRPLMTLVDEDGNDLGLPKSTSEVEAMEKASKLGPGRYILKRPDAEIVVKVKQPAEKPPVPQPSGDIFGITVTGTGPATFGVPLREGDVPRGTSLVVTKNGKPVASQWQPLANWRTDDSVLHGLMTFDAEPGQYGVAIGSVDVSERPLVVPSASITAVVDGVAYRIECDPQPGAGPMMHRYTAGGHLIGPDGPHSTLQGYFHVREYHDRARVTFVVENTACWRENQDYTADVTLELEGKVVHQQTLVVGADKRYPKAFWTAPTDVWVQHDTDYLQSTRLVPNYQQVDVAESVLTWCETPVEWGGRGVFQAALGSGGAKAWLAPLERWCAAYLITGDRRAYDCILAHSDAYHWLSNIHLYAMRLRDENTGLPLDISQYPKVIGHAWGGPNAIPASAQTLDPITTDIAHWPSGAYLAYLLTGEKTYLEECQFWGVSAWVMENPGSWGAWPRTWFSGQIRALAWGLRNIVSAAIVTPDDHPMKNTLDSAVGFALDSMTEKIMPLSPLGVAATDNGVSAVVYTMDGDPGVGFAPWMDDYLTWAIGDAQLRGWSTPDLWHWKAQGISGRFSTEYNWRKACPYNLRIRDTKDSQFYASWGDLYKANFGDDWPDGQLNAIPTGYWAQVGAGLALMKETRTDDSWDTYAENVTIDYSTAPEWALEPRAS